MGPRLSVARHFSAVLCERPVRSQSRFVSEIKWSLFGLASLAIALRLLTRSPLLHGAGLGWDDASISLAYVFLVAEEAGSEIIRDPSVVGSSDYTIWDVGWQTGPFDSSTDRHPSQCFRTASGETYGTWIPIKLQRCLSGSGSARSGIVSELFFSVLVPPQTNVELMMDASSAVNIMTWTKVSILAMCLRVWPRSTTTHLREAIYAVMAIIILSDTAFTLSIIFSCRPVQAAYTNWDLEHPGQCIQKNPHFIAMGVVNIVLDLAVFFLPIPKLLKTQLPTKKKLGISMTFLVGLLVTIFSIVRLAMAVPALSTDNPSYDLVQVVAWSQFEFNFAIICACMPNYAGPIQRAWKWFRGLEPSKLRAGVRRTEMGRFDMENFPLNSSS
ncbi:hypothetical protein KC356_g7858 [Hortaea werneckii]|nr:hypothetical protein KC356_g7858 [Hortaea werneckii]